MKNKSSWEELFKADKTFRYQLLGRMQQDCEYWLGYGGRNDKKLWALEKKRTPKINGRTFGIVLTRGKTNVVNS